MVRPLSLCLLLPLSLYFHLSLSLSRSLSDIGFETQPSGLALEALVCFHLDSGLCCYVEVLMFRYINYELSGLISLKH